MEIYKLKSHTDNYCLMATLGSVSAGEPREVESLFERVDLNEFITNRSEDIYMIRARGDSMEAEIKDGDWMIVNRALQAKKGDKILACLGNSYTVKIFSHDEKKGLRLVASNGKYAPRTVTETDNFEIFGVVIFILRAMKKF